MKHVYDWRVTIALLVFAFTSPSQAGDHAHTAGESCASCQSSGSGEGGCLTCKNIWDGYCDSKQNCIPAAKYPFQNKKSGHCGHCCPGGNVGIYGVQTGACGCGHHRGGFLHLFKKKRHAFAAPAIDGGCNSCGDGEVVSGGNASPFSPASHSSTSGYASDYALQPNPLPSSVLTQPLDVEGRPHSGDAIPASPLEPSAPVNPPAVPAAPALPTDTDSADATGFRWLQKTLSLD